MVRGKKTKGFALVFLPVFLLAMVLCNGSASASNTVHTDVEMKVLPRITVNFASDLVVTKASVRNKLYETAVSTEIRTNSKSGYKAFISTNRSRVDENDIKATGLVGIVDDSKVIPTLEEEVLAEEFPVNHWGISIDGGAHYIGLPAYNDEFNANLSSTNALENRTFDLYFGTKIDDLQEYGYYESTIVVTAVANYVAKTIDDIAYMQDINDEVALSMVEEHQYQLKDRRDGKYYWVSRLKDGNVWMTQDLDLAPDSETGVLSFNPETSDVRTNVEMLTNYIDSTGNLNMSGYNSATPPTVWELGDYILDHEAVELVALSTDNQDPELITSSEYLANVFALNDEDLHHHLGNKYTAAAVFPEWSDSIYNSTNADRDLKDDSYDKLMNRTYMNTSICPYGWRIPYQDEFKHLLAHYGLTEYNRETLEAGEKLNGTPFYYTGSGFAINDNVFYNLGSYFTIGVTKTASTGVNADLVYINIIYGSGSGGIRISTSSDSTTSSNRASVRCGMRWN